MNPSRSDRWSAAGSGGSRTTAAAAAAVVVVAAVDVTGICCPCCEEVGD